MDFSSHIFAISGAIALFILYNLWRTRKRKTKGLIPPEPSGALPIIGHLHLLGTHKTLARTWASMADKHGPIFSILLGGHRALVVSDSELVKECFTRNDRVLAARPKSSHGKYLSYNYAAFGFASYGTSWRETRKLAVIQLLSNQRIKSLRQVLVSEVDCLVKDLYTVSCKNGMVSLVFSEWLERLSINMITRMLAGKRYFKSGGHEEEGVRIEKLMKEFMYVSGVFVPSDTIPFLGWMDYFPGPVRTIKRVARELDSLMEGWIEEHKLRRVKGEVGGELEDFIDVMLSIMDDHMFGHTREAIIKGTALTLIMAGADTTSISLTWIFSNLLNNPHTLKLAQEELDTKVGKDRIVEDNDIENLHYLQAIIKETLRLYPPGPLAVPHEAMEDCSIGGYCVPKGTRVFANLWKLHRDPNIWKKPEEFNPERFLKDHANVDVSGKHFEFIPFGSGRRSCPGMALALQVLHLTVARLLQGFSFSTPNNVPVDMSEGLGITLPKATPLEVQIVPRLSPQLYDCQSGY